MSIRPAPPLPDDDNLPTEKTELSDREVEILRLVATGASNKEIAQKLFISPNTVKVHLRNIFAKIGAVSRTEATLYAIRHGWVQVETVTPPTPAAAPEPTPGTENTPAETAPPVQRPSRLRWIMAEVVVLILLLLTPFAWRALNPSPTALPTAAATSTPQPRWQEKAPLPEARAGLAAAAFENMIYAIAGETASGVIGRLDRYDPSTDAWVTLTSKPVAVADVNAAVVGGRIYVPGGRLASGVVTNTLEVYNPRTDSWEQRAPLPVALSAYALVAFEGKLYVFGGWDGAGYIATTYEYDPTQDVWAERTPMPTARAYAGAAVVGGRIYVVGGEDARGTLAVNEEYTPEGATTSSAAWNTRAPLPAPRTKVGMAGIADIIHVVGGDEANIASSSPVEFFASQNAWQSFEAPLQPVHWAHVSLVANGSYLYAVGGMVENTAALGTYRYQAIYTVALPVVQ